MQATCVGNNITKKMFGCPLKLILGFFGILYVFNIKPNYSYTTMYECEKSSLTHELSYMFSLKVVSCKFHL
jgi:hypothetical protein